jgi:hypothetical protein
MIFYQCKETILDCEMFFVPSFLFAKEGSTHSVTTDM